MTGYYGRNSPKLKSENIHITPTKSPVGNHNTMIRKYLRSDNDENQFSSPKLSRPMRNSSRSPLSAVENIQISPLKVEDDVVVMDGFTIDASKRNVGSGGKNRSSLNSDSSGKYSAGSNSASYSGSGRNSGGSSGHKIEKCHIWEKSGKCRYGSQCQYAHGQEELRPLGSRLNNRNSLEPIIRQPYLSPQSSNNSPINTFAVGNIRSASSLNAKATSNLYRASPSPLQSPSSSSNHSTVSVLTSPYHSAVSVLPLPSPSLTPNHSVVSARPSPNHSAISVLTSPYHSAVSVPPSPSPSPNHSMVSPSPSPSPSSSPSPNQSTVSALPSPNHSMVPALASPKVLSNDWSPMDDAINASEPISREDADCYIHNVLYGPILSKRLPVFVDICPDCSSLAHLSLQSKV